MSDAWPFPKPIDPLDGATTVDQMESRIVDADSVAVSEETAEARSAGQAEFAEDALALKFTDLHGDDLRYTATWGRWNIWTGELWAQDSTLRIFDLARKVCREESERCGDKRQAQRIASAQTVAAVERLARADRRHAAEVRQWDSDPWLLNTPDGVVDLRTGECRPASRDDYMTRITGTKPGGQCSRWLDFLARSTDGDPELQRFIQRMCGYCLTGLTREHALFFAFGTGANGKSVFVNTIAGVLGSYARTASVEVFTDTKGDRHPTDLASLQGARLVTAVETEDGRRWAEARLKALTGGDRIAARFMRQDFFEYVPQFKLIVAGNHKPGLRSVDEAIRRRLHLLPFAVTVPECERDPELAVKLRDEWDGILDWAIQGCLMWQVEGLCAPRAVVQATESYLSAEDVLHRWMEERCALGANLWESAGELFKSWREWAEGSGEFVGHQRRLSENLESRGFAPERTRTARGFRGLALKREPVTQVTQPDIIHVTRARTYTDKPEAASQASRPEGRLLI